MTGIVKIKSDVLFFYSGLTKCKGDVNKIQNEAILNEGAVRLLAHLQGFNFHNEYFDKMG